MTLLDYLRPTPAEIERLALREADPAHYAEFEPITRGFAYAAGIIALVGLTAVAVTPFRLLARAFRRFR